MRNGFSNDNENLNIRSGVSQTSMEEEINIKGVKKPTNRKSIILCVFWLVLCIFVFVQVFDLAMYTIGKKEKKDMWLYNGMNGILSVIIPKDNRKEVTDKYTVSLAALGDIYATSNVISGAKTGTTYSFTDGFKALKEKLSTYDVVLGSLNTPVAGSGLSYSSKNVYNSPDEILDLVKYLGITVVGTASNHLNDKGEKGITLTMNALKAKELNQVGLNETADRAKPYIIEKNTIKIGVLSYVAQLEIKLAKGKEHLMNVLTEENVKADVAYLKEQGVDFIISYLGIPNEDSTRVSAKQKSSVELLFNNGINVVLGTGSKVVQSAAEDLFEIDETNKNHVYSIYCLGDVIGSMETEEKRMSVVADISFTKSVTKDKEGNVVDSKTTKSMMVNTPIKLYNSLSATNKVTNYLVDKEIENYTNNTGSLSKELYTTLKAAGDKIAENLQ